MKCKAPRSLCCFLGTILRKFQVGSEKYMIHWLLVINRKSSEFSMIEVNLRYSGGDLLEVTAEVIDMPHRYSNTHPEIHRQFWDPEHWPKHVLVIGLNQNLEENLHKR